MSRWIEKEVQAIAEIRKRLAVKLAEQPEFPEGLFLSELQHAMHNISKFWFLVVTVVGDRRLLRFLRGKQHNIEEATEMISNFLTWRKDNNVDSIRQDIVYGGKNTPLLFPSGQKIIDLAPQIIISANALDNEGRPLAFEAFDFTPKEVLKQITIAEYLQFLTYSLEYRAIVLEQMSHEREQRYLIEHPNVSDRVEGYGVILMDFTIRDLKGLVSQNHLNSGSNKYIFMVGVGLAHLGSEGRQLVGEALKLGLGLNSVT